jgi:beta-lactamase superfamily II metal-dependent hydrolase
MAQARSINVDLAALTREDGTFRTMLAWGDPVSVVDEDTKKVKVEVIDYVEQPDGSILPKTSFGFLKRKLGSRNVTTPTGDSKVLKVDFVDVQQGDGALIETPGGRVITLDGGDNQLFARYLASRYPGTSLAAPLEIDAMVVSHGDADHFAGLAEIHDSETLDEPRKRLFVHPARVFHNGLVKRPSSVSEAKQLGRTRKVGGETIITGLESNLLDVPETEMNAPFKKWKKALRAWHERAPIACRRMAQGDGAAFDEFLAGEGIEVDVLGPVLTTKGNVTGLRFLGTPRKGAQLGPQPAEEEFSGLDPSHTINGHSIVLRLGFGNWRMLFAGDLNTQAEQTLTKDHEAGRIDLGAEVFKVPHHGSAEFSGPFLAAVQPVVSVVSSGDESARKEYMHPRATLMSALGEHARDGSVPVVFVTELVAFFETVGWVRPDAAKGVDGKPPKGKDKNFFAFRRTAYGLVRVRTDGSRLLVYTNSGQTRLKEAYAYEATAAGEVKPAAVRKA